MVSKTLQLLFLLPRRPLEFCDRVTASLTTRWRESGTGNTPYRVVTHEEGLSELSGMLGAELRTALEEPELERLEADLGRRETGLTDGAPFNRAHNGGSALAGFCYAVTRALKPELVLETGVCYGVTSAHFLQALKMNGRGELHSIDLPPLGKNGDAYVGTLVSRELRQSWTVHRGTARRLLPKLLTSLGQIDLFLHDSLHTYRNMRMEFAKAWPKLRPGGVLISDDVDGNAAFRELAKRHDVAASVVLREDGKKSLFGIAVKRR
jgi:predicted O-methyltransferase YrrM